MMEEINAETGHKASCKFDQLVKRSILEIYADACTICKVAAPSNRQCCDLRFCSVCWKKFCWLGEWDPELSRCANYLCDVKKFSLEQRAHIHQFNIKGILDLPATIACVHISKNRRSLGLKLRKEFRSYFPENKKRKECPEETSVAQIPPVLAQIQPNLAQKMKIS